LRSIWLLLLFTALRAGAGDWLAQAQRHFEQRRWEESRAAALKALEAEPRLGDAYVLLGLVATVQSDFSEAEARFKKAIELQPANPRAHAYLGSTYLQLKRYDEARQSFQTVLKLDGSNLSARYNLGLVALATHRPAEALALFEKVHRVEPTDVGALIGMLESQLLLKRSAEARESVSKTAALLDSRDPRLFQLATMLALYGEYAAAIPLLERAREAHPDSYDVNYNLALTRFRSAHYEGAAETLMSLLTRQKPAEAYNLLGAVEEKRGRISEAVSALQKAAELEPRNEDFRFDYSAALLLYSGEQDVVSAFEAASRDFPASPRMQLGLGAAHYVAGNYEAAVQALLLAVKMDPDARPAYRLLGLSYETTPRMQSEIANVLEAYLKRHDDDALIHYHYGSVLSTRVRSGEDLAGEAKEHLLRAIVLEPRFAEAHMQLGILAQEEGDLASSAASLRRAVQLAPELASAHYRLGLVYQKLGQKENANAELDLFRKLKVAHEASERKAIAESVRESAVAR
jgi:tetratricopeptide (TPR) repeat protein